MELRHIFKVSILTLAVVSLFGCNSDTDKTDDTDNVVAPSLPDKVTFQPSVTNQIPADMQVAKEAGFTRYTELTFASSPNLKIRILGTDDDANNEKIIRAGNIIFHLLQNLPNSTYGKDKTSIAQTMAKREATLLLTKDNDENEEMSLKLFVGTAIKLNLLSQIIIDSGIADSASLDTSDLTAFITGFSGLTEDDQEAIIQSMIPVLASHPDVPLWLKNNQSLQYRELTVEGDCHYMSNFSPYCTNLGEDSDRDAAFEEILHLVQSQGIAPNIDTKSYQESVRARAESIYQDKLSGQNVPWNPSTSDWNDWKDDDINADEIGPSYSHEYLAAAFETYMGMWAHQAAGLDGYTSTQRAQMSTKDDIGEALIREMFHGDLQYTARIQSEGVAEYYTKAKLSGTPTFKMALSSAAEDKYTFKSQYLVNAKLTGSAAVDLIGNDKNNILEGNSADNTIDAGAGNDTIYAGAGNDTINGNTGDDTIYAGAGTDTFVVTDTPLKTNNYQTCVILPGFDDKLKEHYFVLKCPKTGNDILYGFEKVKFLDYTATIDGGSID